MVATGTEIRNVAWITFDQQPAIATDWVDPHNPEAGVDTNKQALVTIDADIPTSSVASLLALATNATFTVSWTGTDIGTGVAGYDVYVQTNYGLWNLWLANTPLTSALFPRQQQLHSPNLGHGPWHAANEQLDDFYLHGARLHRSQLG